MNITPRGQQSTLKPAQSVLKFGLVYVQNTDVNKDQPCIVQIIPCKLCTVSMTEVGADPQIGRSEHSTTTQTSKLHLEKR